MDMTWEEQLRSDGWKFEMYRTRQWWGQIDDDDVEAFRIAWRKCSQTQTATGRT